jgi:UDP-N-acetylglucosamine:LPS N-acetylglucosamine transferase
MSEITLDVAGSFFGEIEKIALKDRQKNQAVGTAAVGTAAAAGSLKALEGISEDVGHQRPERVRIYYTDPRRGAGHLAQGKAVKKKLEEILGKKDKLGRDTVELINFDAEFSGPRGVDPYNKAFNKYRGDPQKSLAGRSKYLLEYVRFYGSLDQKKMVRSMSEKGVMPIFANPQLGWSAQRGGITHGISMQTDQAPWKGMDPTMFRGRSQRHIASESAKSEFFEQHNTLKDRTRIVPDLATEDPPKNLKAPMKDAISGKPIRMDGKFNITITGGAQGWDADRMTRETLKSDLPEGTVIHVITGGDKQPDGSIRFTKAYRDVQKMLGEIDVPKGVEVRAYGWSPARQMMALADVNVLRPHGTFISEATVAGKPMILAIPDSPLDMEINDAKATGKHLGQPAVQMDEIPKAMKLIQKDYGAFQKRVAKQSPRSAGAARRWAEAIVDFGSHTKFRFAGRGAQYGAMGLLGVSAGASGLLAHRLGATDKIKGMASGHWRKIGPGQEGKDRFGSKQLGRTWVKTAEVEKKDSIRIGMGIVSAGLLALGVASARRGSTLRSIQNRLPIVTTQSKDQFLSLLKPGDVILNQVKEGRGVGKAISGRVIKRAQGGKSHASIYVGDGQIAHIAGYSGSVQSLEKTYLKGDRSLLVIRPQGDGDEIADLARKSIRDYQFNKFRIWGVGASDMAPAAAQRSLFKKIDKGDVICTTTVADILDKSGVDLPKNPGGMLAVDFQKMSNPPVIKFQGTMKEVKTSSYQGAGLLIPGAVLATGAAVGIPKQASISLRSMSSFWEELEKLGEVEKVEKERSIGAALSGAASGTFLLNSGPKATSHTSSKNEKYVVYYTDPHRGAGHYAQGRAIVEALERKGVNAELRNFDEDFIDPMFMKRSREAFQRFYNNPTEANRLQNISDYNEMHFGKGLLREKLIREMTAPGVQPVFANVHLGHTAQNVGVFNGIGVHTDQEAWGWSDPSEGGRRSMRHIVPESAVGGLFKQHKTIRDRSRVVPDLAISELTSKPMVDKMTKSPIRMDGKFNITVSGGGLGIDADKMTKNLIKADLPEGTVIHVVTGGTVQDGKILPNPTFEASKKINPPKGVEIRVYGWSPLRQMMNKADLNLLRPHGTSITEATASGRPFVLTFNAGGHGSAIDNAMATSKVTGQPAVAVPEIPDAINEVIKNYRKYESAVKRRSVKAQSGADRIADAITDFGGYKVTTTKAVGVSMARRGVGLGLGVTSAILAGSAVSRALKDPTSAPSKSAGHWRKIPLGQKGKSPSGGIQSGRTWVKTASWSPTPNQIHVLARMKGIEADSQLPGSGAFLALSRDLTDKEHLDKMTAAERRRVYYALMLA